MLLYNVTVKIEKEIESDWLTWMIDQHIPEVLKTGQFVDSRISRLLDQPEEDDPTYVIQYECESMEEFEFYISNYAPALRDQHNSRYKDKFVAFRTLMEVVA